LCLTNVNSITKRWNMILSFFSFSSSSSLSIDEQSLDRENYLSMNRIISFSGPSYVPYQYIYTLELVTIWSSKKNLIKMMVWFFFLEFVIFKITLRPLWYKPEYDKCNHEGCPTTNVMQSIDLCITPYLLYTCRWAVLFGYRHLQ
jgi:hypothetical protein